MTICIAALCDNNPKHVGRKILLCTDGQSSSALGTRDFVIKNQYLHKSWRCLTAGGEADLLALMPRLKARLKEHGPIDETTIVQRVRLALQDRKLEKSNEYTLGRYGLSYAEFLRDGKKTFPDDHFRADIFAISQMELNIECLVAGFLDDGLPIILHLDGKCAVTIKEDFATAGEGAFLAEASLIYRQHSDFETLERALYFVYEAKKAAQRVASVNDWTHLTIVSKDGVDLMNAQGRTYLEEQYKKYAPQKVSEPIAIDQSNMFKRYRIGVSQDDAELA